MESSGINFDFREFMMEYWKPRNEHLYNVLSGRKGGAHEDPFGHKKQKRSKVKQETRKLLKEQLSGEE